ncbi:MAG: hypothetical protein KDK12_15400 [Rhodobacteraceae bacterium]|nr:hypothetical protein [Paracoccaceae bacterium]
MQPEIVMIVSAAAAVGAVLGFVLGRFGGGTPVIVVAVLGVVAGVAMMMMGESAGGWDGLAYAIGAVFIDAPFTLAVALFGWIGTRMRSR